MKPKYIYSALANLALASVMLCFQNCAPAFDVQNQETLSESSTAVDVDPDPPADPTSYQFPGTTRITSKGVIKSLSTFESISLYFDTPNGSTSQTALVRYRIFGSTNWQQGQSLWFDARSQDVNDLQRAPIGFSRQYRGSLVQLKSGTEYEIEVMLSPSGEHIAMRTKTWSENFPIAKTIEISENRTTPLTISESGTANGYVLVTSKPGESPVIDVEGKSDFNINVTGSYIIIRGLTLKNSAKHGVLLGTESHNVVIENCDISGWGRIAQDSLSKANGWGMNLDSAISTTGKLNPSVTQLVIQRNKIHDPRSTSNNWSEPRQDYDENELPRFTNGQPLLNPHPIGPQGISLTATSGNHVIRYNRIYSSDPMNGKKLNDAIGGGGSNFTTGGAPGRDSDIYGNEISDTWDDGIESEGGNINLRIWNNSIHHTYMSIAISPVAVGPIYIFRNVGGFTRRNPTDTKGGNFIKGQSRIQMKKVRDPKDATKVIQVPDFIAGGGRVYVYHNTTVGQLNVGISRSSEQLLNYVTRNNIFVAKETAIQGQVPLTGAAPNLYPKFDRYLTNLYQNDYDYDLFSTSPIVTESKEGESVTPQFKYELNNEERGYKGTPTYDTTTPSGPYALKPGTLGHDAGVVLPGFNDGYSGKAPDIGAQELGTEALRFGLR